MTLRDRLLLGNWYLVALLMVAAFSATFGFFHLSAGIDVVLEENFKSIHASMRMMEALERQDSFTLAALIDGQAAGPELGEYESQFRDALSTARGNLTESDEMPVLDGIERSFEAYCEARDRLIERAPERPLAAYRQEVFPHFSEAKGEVLELLEINQNAMFEADRRARETAVGSGVWLGVLVGVALLSLIFLSRALQRHFLSRLSRLERSMAAIAEGEEGKRLREDGRDELTAIARQFNRLLDQRQRLEAAADGRVAQERRLLIGLLSALGPGNALYGLTGELFVSREGGNGGAARIGQWIRDAGRRLAEEQGAGSREAEVDLGEGGRVHLRLLRAGTDRPVGWLAEPVRGSASRPS